MNKDIEVMKLELEENKIEFSGILDIINIKYVPLSIYKTYLSN